MQRRGVLLCLVVFALVPVATGGCSTNPLTGKRSFMLLTVADEIQLGREAAPEMTNELGGTYADPVISAYVQGVGRKVAAEALKVSSDYPYTFDVLDTDVVNAFALPGGPVFITRGLLWQMQDESQLAGVLAHEVTHVAAQHSAQRISKAVGAEVILSVLKAAAGKGESADGSSSTAADIAKIVAGLVSLKYSRDDETEADLYGVDFMVRAGYQPTGLVRVMEMFKRLEQEAGSGGPEFLRTHPNPKNRAAAIREAINEKHPGAETDPKLTVGRESYQKNVLSRQHLVKTYSKAESN